MKVINALHVTCDMLLFFTVAAMFAPFADAALLIAASLAAVFAAALLAQQCDKFLLRVLCGLVPFAALFAARNNVQLIATGVALAACFAVIASGKLSMKYENYRFWFGVPAVIVCVLVAVCIGKGVSAHRITVLCGCVYLFLGVLILRRKRMGRGAGAEAKLLSTAELAAGVTFGTAGAALLYLLLAGSAALIRLLQRSFRGISEEIAELIEKIKYLVTGKSNPGQMLPEELTQDLGPVGNQGTGHAGGMPASWFGAFEKALAIFVVIALIALIAWLIIRRIRNAEKKAGAARGEEFEGGEAGPAGERAALRRKDRKRRKAGAPLTDAERVREIYRQYLELAKKHGIEVVRPTTSGDVLEASKKIQGSAEDEALRGLYIRARYDDPDGVGGEDVRRAEELWKTIKERIEAGEGK